MNATTRTQHRTRQIAAGLAIAAVAAVGAIGIALTLTQPTESEAFNRACAAQGGYIDSDSGATIERTATLHGDTEFTLDPERMNVRICTVDGEIVATRIVQAAQ